ncbi:hypothetical protein ABIF07_001073 [Bradyrhizobium elkanii]|uniref:hypothetical protein n=1 Tax=Bradyrhizobium elkanii TaxID=29448 RepID=UPI00216865D8|nr:hypothetical protein [Bradyrhizobium elkanii]MCS3692011.1 hypothetical protein [Bradyrhizobium elkanii]
MARIRIPPPDVPAIDPATGLFNRDWYDVLKALERLRVQDLSDVTTSNPADTNTIRYSAAGKVWNFGA